MTPADLSALLELATQHKWIACWAFVIGLAVRYLGDDTFGPVVAKRWKPLAALGVAVAEAVADKVALGTPLKDAIGSAIVSLGVAAFGHAFVVKMLRNGVEVPVPGSKAKVEHAAPPPPEAA